MSLKIGTKIILVIEAMMVVMVVFASITMYYILKKNTEKQVFTYLESVSLLKENSISGFLDEVVSEIEFLNNRSTVRTYLLSYLKDGYKESKDIIANRTTDLLKYKKVFTKVMVEDKDGLIVYSTNALDEGKIVANEPFFVNAKDKTYVQDYHYDLDAEESIMTVSTPIRDDEGKFMGVLSGRINVERINSLMMERSGMGVTGETFLVNSFNMVVTDLLKQPGSAMKKTIYLPQVVNCLKGESHDFRFSDYNGDMVYGYYRWMPNVRSCLVAKMDINEALMPVGDVIWKLILMLSVGGILMGIFGFLVAKRLVRPINDLHLAMKRVEAGDFDAQSTSTSGDEIGGMAMSFNQMTHKLKISYGGLEEAVKSKTQELENKLEELQKLNELMVGRELKMMELKKALTEKEGS